MSSKGRWLTLTLYVALVAAFVLPSGVRLSQDLIGQPGGDNLQALWNVWWLRRSLLQLGNPWWTDMLFAPEGTHLVWHSLALLPSSAVALLSTVVPVPLAFNAVMLAALPLAGLSAFLLCRHLTADVPGAFAGGTVFMLCPFVVSKTLGHLDLAYAGLLPLFYLALLRAVDDPGDRGRLPLAAASLLLVFASNPNASVFAANLAFFLLCLHARRASWALAVRRFASAFAPTFLLALPYLAVVLYYAITWADPPRTRGSLDYAPEAIAYLLPFTPTSIYSGAPRRLGLAGLDGVEPAVYLGLAVLPIAVAGLVLRRREPLVPHLALVAAVFLVLSMGPKLLWQREVVEISDYSVYLPFGLWRWVPLLGSVGQSGRYAIIVYMVAAVGVAHAVAWVCARRGERMGMAAAAAAVAIAAADFAFRPVFGPLPAPLQLSARGPGRVRVLDPRLGSADTVYQQTLHERPVLGGYLSRAPRGVVAGYAKDPILGWLFDDRPVPGADDLIARLRELGVGDVLLDPDDERAEVLERAGFVRRPGSPYTAVWSRPE